MQNDYIFQTVKTDEEMNELENLAYEIWQEYWTPRISKEQTDYMIRKFQSFDALKKQIQNENHIYKILKSDNSNAAYFGICIKQTPKPYLFLSKLYVKSEFRFKGLGKVLFEEIKDISKRKNLKKIQLTINKYNSETLEKYKKWGFRITDSVITDIGGGFVMDDYVMEYDLN